MRVNSERLREVLGVLRDPQIGPFYRIQMSATGSEFAQGDSRDKVSSSITCNGGAPTELLRIVPPSDEAWKVTDLQFDYYEALGGALTSDIEACAVEVLQGGKLAAGTISRVVGETVVRNNRPHFGAIPLDVWVTKENPLVVQVRPGGLSGGTDAAIVAVSVSIRKEPRQLAEAAGFIEASKVRK